MGHQLETRSPLEGSLCDYHMILYMTLHDFTWTLRDSLHTLHGLYMIVYILYVTLRGLYVISRKLT